MIQGLNTHIDLTIKANSFLNQMLPTAGVLVFGEQGIEFLASNGGGYIQIPWGNIELVKAQVFFGGRYIRGFDILTDDQQTLSFVAANSKAGLKVMRQYIGSEKLVKNPSNFKKLWPKKK